MVEWRLDCENCRHLTVVGLHDTGPWIGSSGEEVRKRFPAYQLTNMVVGSVHRISFSFSLRWHLNAREVPYALHVPPLSRLRKAALETVPKLVWLNTDRSRPRKVECRPLSFSTPLSSRRSMLWCSGPFMFRKFLKPRSTFALPSCRPDVISAVHASLSARSFSHTPACPG